MSQISTQKELRNLLRACRQLMREILTISHEDRGEEWLSFLTAATRQVEEATRCVQDFDQRDSSSGVGSAVYHANDRRLRFSLALSRPV